MYIAVIRNFHHEGFARDYTWALSILSSLNYLAIRDKTVVLISDLTLIKNIYIFLGHHHSKETKDGHTEESIWAKTRNAMQRYNSQRRKDFQWEKLDEEAAQYDFSQAYQSGMYVYNILYLKNFPSSLREVSMTLKMG